MADDEEEVPLSAQTRRPLDTALRQQRVVAWYPILDPWWVVGAFIVLGVAFVPTGFVLQSISDGAVIHKSQYDAYDNPHEECGINTTANAGRECFLNFSVTEDMEPPIMVHYEVDNFHQNHRTYVNSRDDYQLFGSLTQTSIQADLCSPLNFLGKIRLNPCGLIANTFFNDKISLVSGVDDTGVNLVMREDGIAWQSDLDYKFRQPDTFNSEECPNNTCDASCCDGSEWSCTVPWNDTDGKCYRYFYPDDETTQYLYETYPQISPLVGVRDEHFIVWMRVAALPNFRKLYGWIDQKIPAGTTLRFRIVNNWEVTSFQGRKALVVSTTTTFGGKNNLSGPFYIGVGAFCLGAALFFSLKQFLRPRKTADRKYLQYKED